jgi:hypothetical protein
MPAKPKPRPRTARRSFKPRGNAPNAKVKSMLTSTSIDERNTASFHRSHRPSKPGHLPPEGSAMPADPSTYRWSHSRQASDGKVFNLADHMVETSPPDAVCRHLRKD